MTSTIVGRPSGLRVAVTGGSGFIGSHVVDKLLDAGHDVAVIDPRRPHRDDAVWLPVDILDQDALNAATRGLDAVFHLAAVANVDEAAVRPVETVELNVLATARVMEAARTNGVGQVVLASTVWVYGAGVGDGGELLDEETPFDVSRADHVYTASKLAAETVVQSFGRLYGQHVTILRYGIPYGSRMRENLVMPIFVRQALDGRPLTIRGAGDQYRNYVHVEDLARAHVLVLGRNRPSGRVYNLEGGEAVSIRRVAETVRDLVGPRVRISFTEGRAGDFQGDTVSAERARTELGWQPTIGFEQGMRRYVAWYRETAGATAAAA